MKLIYNPASPFVRKVWMTLIETGQIDEVELVQVVTTAVNTAAEARAANPLGKIPALVLDDGSTIYDSRVLCRFFDTKANAGLYPEADLWRLLTLEATADGIMEAALMMVYERRLRPEEIVYEPIIEAQWQKAAYAVAHVNASFMDFLNGPFSMAHIVMGAALGYLDFRLDVRNWRDGNPALAAWYDAFKERPSMQTTWPE
jgi:glutathione S-transferase